MPQDKTGDFDAWLKGQRVEPKTAAPKSSGGDFDSWAREQEEKSRPQSRTLMPTERQEFRRRPSSFDETLSLQRQARLRPTPVDWGRPSLETPEEEQRRKRAEFERKPILTRAGERVYDAFARSGGYLSKAARQGTGAELGVARGLVTGDYSPVDIPAWRRYEEERDRELAEQRQARPSSFVTDVAEGIIEAAPVAAGGYLLGAAGGGGILATTLTGGGMAAAGADWRDPKRAAVQTALGAAGPVLGGKVGGAVASRLVRPASRVAGELIGGGAGNVLASGVEQGMFEGRISPRELAKAAVIGSALSAPGAIGAARRAAPEQVSQPAAQPVTRPEAARAAIEPPRVLPEPVRRTAEMLRQARGPIRQTAEIPRVDAAPTGRVVYPDAPETQEMPAIRERIAAENAPTAEIPRVKTGETQRRATTPEPGPRESGLLQASVPGRPVTQEVQIPGLKASETHATREDARQGHFERFTDEELVDEIRRMEDVRNQGIRGRSKLSREELETNNFDLRIAVEQQKERRRLQQQIGVEPGERIAPRTPERPGKVTVTEGGRKIQHSQFGELTEAADQAGVRKGYMRVVDAGGKLHIIKNPRRAGNREAAFVRSTGPIPAEAMPEMQGKSEAPIRPGPRQSYAIPDEAMPELQVRGFGLGGFGKVKLPSRAEAAETAGGVQAVAQLGNPRFVIRNVLQHIAFGKQERTATRLAAAIDWAYSKATGKGRQIAAPQGSDLASYVRNWRKAVAAHKAGQALPGGSSPIAHTANANAIDKGVQKLMTWMNEIPDSANWQTRFEDSLQSIVRKGRNVNMADAIDQATMEANRAALRDSNFASSAMLKIKQGLNTLSSPIFGTDKFGVGDFVVKYAQTPGALLKRGLERSPLGLFQVAKEAATPGPFRRRNTLLALSRVAEGAATGVGLGAALGAAGVLVGPEEDKKTGRAMEREEGVRGYSLNASALRRLLTGDTTEMQAGDTLYSIDWLQPWAMNLSAGAALWNLHKGGKLGVSEGGKAAGQAIYDSLSKTLDVMGDQSILKNLSRYLDKATGETFSEKFYNFAKAIGLDVPSSFVPSLARQVRQVVDPYERDTRPERRGGLGGFVEEAKNRALGQIPGVSSSFPTRPSLLTGEDRKTAIGEMGMGSRVAAQFSPANVSTYTPRAVAREISRLNQAGEKVVVSFPAPKADRRTGEREVTSSLRGRERTFAETWSRMSQEMIDDPAYKGADNETRAAAFAELKRHLAGLGKEDFEEKGVDEIIEAATAAVEKRREKE